MFLVSSTGFIVQKYGSSIGNPRFLEAQEPRKMNVCKWIFICGMFGDVQRSEVGPLTIEVEVPSKKTTHHQPVTINVTIQSPPAVQVIPEKIEVGSLRGTALILGFRPEGPDKWKGQFGEIAIRNWRIELEPTQLGIMKLPDLKATYQEASKPPVSFNIALPEISVIAENDVPAVLHSPPDLPAERSPVRIARDLKAAGIAGLIIALMLWAFRGRRANSPAQQSLRAIAEIKQNPPEPRLAVHQVCDALRKYLVARYGLPAETKSVPDFFRENEVMKRLPEPRRRELQKFLLEADYLRFPEKPPTREQLTHCIEFARDFLSREDA
jgi:hypothetical protein